ncbi:MAG: EamA family transporter RarD [Clostridia bacterium]
MKATATIVIAYVMWGIFPFFWRMLGHVDSLEVVAYRILFSFLLCLLVLVLSGRISFLRQMKDARRLATAFFSGLLLAVNWFVFIYAVVNDHLIDASLGYFLNPLVSVLLGRIFLKEAMDQKRIMAVVLVSLGVAIMVLSSGVIPIIALVLAFTFALYGLIKKKSSLGALESMSSETMSLLPISLAILLYRGTSSGISLFSPGMGTNALIVLSGAVTLVPLLLFSSAAKKIPLHKVGFLQYIAPTMMFLSGIALGERMEWHALASFAFIWMGLLVYSVPSGGSWRRKSGEEVEE